MLASELAEISRQEQTSFVQGLLLAKMAPTTSELDISSLDLIPELERVTITSNTATSGTVIPEHSLTHKDDGDWEELDDDPLKGARTEATGLDPVSIKVDSSQTGTLYIP